MVGEKKDHKKKKEHKYIRIPTVTPKSLKLLLTTTLITLVTTYRNIMCIAEGTSSEKSYVNICQVCRGINSAVMIFGKCYCICMFIVIHRISAVMLGY